MIGSSDKPAVVTCENGLCRIGLLVMCRKVGFPVPLFEQEEPGFRRLFEQTEIPTARLVARLRG